MQIKDLKTGYKLIKSTGEEYIFLQGVHSSYQPTPVDCIVSPTKNSWDMMETFKHYGNLEDAGFIAVYKPDHVYQIVREDLPEKDYPWHLIWEKEEPNPLKEKYEALCKKAEELLEEAKTLKDQM